MKKALFLLLCVFATLPAVHSQKLRVIYETDMGNDIDDAIALDVICKYMDEEKIDLLGVSTHKAGDNICPFVDVMLTWYGYPRVPIAKSPAPVARPQDGNGYADAVVKHTGSDGKPVYKRSKKEKKLCEQCGMVSQNAEQTARQLSRNCLGWIRHQPCTAARQQTRQTFRTYRA